MDTKSKLKSDILLDVLGANITLTEAIIVLEELLEELKKVQAKYAS